MRVGVFSTHPIQYQVPLWKGLNAEKDVDLNVFYFSDHGVSSNFDEGFGETIVWDVPLLEGYPYQFLSKRPIGESESFSIENPSSLLEKYRFDIILIHGYTHRFARQLVRLKAKFDYKIILRGEFTEMARRPLGIRSLAKRIYLKWFYRY